MRFVLGALVINGSLVGAFLLFRHRVAGWPLPGLWWLAAALAATLLTLFLAERTLT